MPKESELEALIRTSKYDRLKNTEVRCNLMCRFSYNKICQKKKILIGTGGYCTKFVWRMMNKPDEVKER